VSFLDRFARLLGLPPEDAEDALHSDRAARAVLTRRSFFAAAGAMAAGTAFSFAPPVDEFHYLFRSGDYPTKLVGVGNWMPTDPGPFFGVDRSSAVLKGWRMTAPLAEQKIIQAVASMREW
jgi:hypothetical protein